LKSHPIGHTPFKTRDQDVTLPRHWSHFPSFEVTQRWRELASLCAPLIGARDHAKPHP